MKKSLGLWGLAAALSLCLTACGGGNARYGANNDSLYDNNANGNGTVTNGDGTLTGDGVTDFGDTARKRVDNGATAYDGSATYDNGVTAYDGSAAYDYDDRSMLEEASDAVENGVRRARDGLENAGDAIRDMNANNRTGS